MIRLLPFIVKILIVSVPLISCSEAKSQEKYFNDLGEIRFDSELDDQHFKVCNEDITLPFNFGGVGLVYEGEKPGLVKSFEEKYSYPITEGQTGYITVRFIINCEGKAGRYRVSEMSLSLKRMNFDIGISQQIVSITKDLKGWKPFLSNGNPWDYQQYLTFKIVDGELKKILP